MKNGILLVACLSCICSIIFGEINDSAVVAHWKQKAEEGDADSQYTLGVLYAVGKDVPKDDLEAVKWFEKAAEQGHVDAQASMGFAYASGEGVPNDLGEAVKWFKKAANAGSALAQCQLGLRFEGGLGVSKDIQKAVKWYRLAAKQGDALAQYHLGLAYFEGKGVPVDGEKGMTWLKKAAEQGLPVAQQKLAKCYWLGDGVTKDAQESVKWHRLAAEQGYERAQLFLGVLYANGVGVPKDSEEAFKWFRLAAEQGNADAQYSLGVAYAHGEGVPEDDQEGIKWLQLAAEQGHAMAQSGLGLAYARGEGVAEDDQEAVKWWRLAAEQGFAGAQRNLGVAYQVGEGVMENYVEAYAWYLISSMNGDEQGKKGKDYLKLIISSAQIAAGQQRAKELHALIERKKTIASSDSDKPLATDIAPSGFGSGLMVSGGYVLTCWHVVDGAERISISLNGKDHVASIVQKDAANDIAVLKVAGIPGGVVLNLADDAKLGEKVFTLGYPHPDLQGSDVKFTTGSISSLTGIDNSPRYFQISAPLQSGNSGGPLFDEKGNLVGIVAAKLDSIATLALTGDLPQNVNYAIKADYLEPLLKTVQELEVGKEQTKEVNLLELIEELKKSVVMIKVY